MEPIWKWFSYALVWLPAWTQRPSRDPAGEITASPTVVKLGDAGWMRICPATSIRYIIDCWWKRYAAGSKGIHALWPCCGKSLKQDTLMSNSSGQPGEGVPGRCDLVVAVEHHAKISSTSIFMNVTWAEKPGKTAGTGITIPAGSKKNNLKLRLNMDKTRIIHVNDGFIFLGHRIIHKRQSLRRYAGGRRSRDKNRNFAASLTTLLSGNFGESKIDMVEILNQLKGWAAFYPVRWF